MELSISQLLRAGLLLATALVVVGAVVFLAHHGAEPADYRIFRGEPADLRSVGGVLGLAAELRGRGLIQLGLLALLATPVARVAFSILAFAVQRDRFYVGVTLVVLGVLLWSLAGVQL